MLSLTSSSNVKLGSTQVDRIYLGNTLIWQHSIPIIDSFMSIEGSVAVYIDNSLVTSTSESAQLPLFPVDSISSLGMVDLLEVQYSDSFSLTFAINAPTDYTATYEISDAFDVYFSDSTSTTTYLTPTDTIAIEQEP